MRAKDNQIPEKCWDCKHLASCIEQISYIAWRDVCYTQDVWVQERKLCEKYNWFKWEDRLTKYDFEELA